MAVAPSAMTLRLYAELDQLPHFNPDLDLDGARPEVVERFRAAVASADAILISSPEYAHGVPGSLKNGLDWLVSGPEFPAILVGLLSPSPYSMHAIAALRETLATMSGDLPLSISCTVAPARRPSNQAELLEDPMMAGTLRYLMRSLESEIDRVRIAHRRLCAAAPW